MWLSSGSLNSVFRPVSNSTARSGATTWVVEFVKRPKYWPAITPGREVELERTKAIPKPGLVATSNKIENTKEVEKEEIVVEFEVGFIISFV